MQRFQRRVPRCFSLRLDVLEQLDNRVSRGVRSKWLERLIVKELEKKPIAEQV